MTQTRTQTAKHVHHGRTLAAWVGVILALVAFFVGGFALVLGPIWELFWAAVVLLVIAVIATRVLQVLGHGAS